MTQRDSQHPSAHKTAYWFQREVRLQAENRAAAREDRAEHDPDVALCRAEKARRATIPNPAMEQAKAAWAALLAAEVVAGRGGRKRKQMPAIVKDWEIR